MANFIMKSSSKKQPNWSGKEWSEDACKIYHSFEEASDALKSYWFGGYNTDGHDLRQISIIPIGELKTHRLIGLKKARF